MNMENHIRCHCQHIIVLKTFLHTTLYLQMHTIDKISCGNINLLKWLDSCMHITVPLKLTLLSKGLSTLMAFMLFSDMLTENMLPQGVDVAQH